MDIDNFQNIKDGLATVWLQAEFSVAIYVSELSY